MTAKLSELKTDPDVKIPAAVKAAAELSEKLFSQLKDAPSGSAPSSASSPETPLSDASSSETPLSGASSSEIGEPEKVFSEKTPEVTAPGNTSDTPSGEVIRASEKFSVDTREDNDPDPNSDDAIEAAWGRKYEAMKGRQRKDISKIQQLTERVSALQNIIANFQATTAYPSGNSSSTAQSLEVDPQNLITPEEAADYGEDFLKVVGKRARQEIAPVVDAYKQKIQELERRLEGFSGFVQKDANTRLLDRLDADLPTWREINTNQDFIDWLGLPDPYSGAMRHDMLKAAYAQGDAPRVLAFFNGFLAQEAVSEPAGKEPDYSVRKQPKIPLENLAAPGRAKAAAANNAPAEKPVITRPQIAKFYSDVAAGYYRGRDDEKNRLESEIFSAQQSGRIR